MTFVHSEITIPHYGMIISMALKSSYVEISTQEVKVLAETELIKLLKYKDFKLRNFLIEKFKQYAKWQMLFFWTRRLTLDEFIASYDGKNLCVAEGFQYSTLFLDEDEKEENLKRILGLCQLCPSSQMCLSSSDIKLLGYPTGNFLPISVAESERRDAEEELRLAIGII